MNVVKHFASGVYLEIDGDIFEIRNSSLRPIKNRYHKNKDLKPSKSNKKSDRKKSDREDIDPRMD